MIKSIVTFVLMFGLVHWAVNDANWKPAFAAALLLTVVTVAADFITAVIEGYRNAPTRSKRL